MLASVLDKLKSQVEHMPETREHACSDSCLEGSLHVIEKPYQTVVKPRVNDRLVCLKIQVSL
jgi:hypothetical protein